MCKIYNADGLVDHRGLRPKKTPATVLEEALERTDVRAAVAVWLDLPPVASIGEVVKTAIDREVLRETISYARTEELLELYQAAASSADRVSANMTRRIGELEELLAALSTVARPAFVATCAAFALWASGQMPPVPSKGQVRGFRHLAHHATAAGPDEPSPIRLKPTAAELRYRDSVRRWWK